MIASVLLAAVSVGSSYKESFGSRLSNARAFARIKHTDIFSINWLIVSAYDLNFIFEILLAIFLKNITALSSHAPKQSTTHGRGSMP